jgi:hypothetical protein
LFRTGIFLVRIKEEHKRDDMILKSMRSVLVLLLVCLVIAGMASAAISPVEQQSASCTGDSYAGLPGGSVIAVVDVSGHGNTFIDGKTLAPAGTEKVQGYDADWYGTTPGTHTILITSPGYINFITSTDVCTGKVSYVYYDQDAHLAVGMTKNVTTTTTVPVTTTFAGQSTDYSALKAALGSTTQPETSGSLSVTTDPAGATIYIDGAQQGISPATIPGLSPGSHTILLKLDGYQDRSAPVTIAAGQTQTLSSALSPAGTPQPVLPAATKTPGFEAAGAAGAVGALLLIRKIIS